MEIFRQVQWAYKLSDALVQTAFQQAVKGTPLMPRDLFLMASSGRMHRVIDDQGRSWWSLPAIENVSDSLDVIAQLPGQMMIRRADRWGPLPTGADGEVLTFDLATGLPTWRAPVAPPGSAEWGLITGDITTQVDLVDALDAAAATAAWGGINGALADQIDLKAALDALTAAIAGCAKLVGTNDFIDTQNIHEQIQLLDGAGNVVGHIDGIEGPPGQVTIRGNILSFGDQDETATSLIITNAQTIIGAAGAVRIVADAAGVHLFGACTVNGVPFP